MENEKEERIDRDEDIPLENITGSESDCLLPEIERLKDALHRDETGLAKSLAEVRKILDSYHWLTEGRGPYAWNDERYKGEVLTMLETIGKVVDKGLSDSGKRSHAYCCKIAPTYEDQQAEIERLKIKPTCDGCNVVHIVMDDERISDIEKIEMLKNYFLIKVK